MKNKSTFLKIMFLSMIIITLSFSATIRPGRAQTTRIFTSVSGDPANFGDPADSQFTAEPGSPVVIFILIENAPVPPVQVGVFNWQIDLKYDPSILVIQDQTPPSDNITNGGWLTSNGGNSAFGFDVSPLRIQIYEFLSGPTQPSPIDTWGFLAIVTFMVTAPGRVTLDIANTLVQDRNSQNVPHTSSDGLFFTDTPVADFSISHTNSTLRNPVVGETITFNATHDPATNKGSYDPNPSGAITNYSWDFDDGTAIVSGPEAIVLHSYSLEGDYHVTLTVTDNSGPPNTNSKSLDIHVSKRDLAVTNIEIIPSVATPGTLVNINVTITNLGTEIEYFNVTLTYNSTMIFYNATNDPVVGVRTEFCLALEDDPNTGSPPAPGLSPSQSLEIAYFWKTAGLTEGNYTLEATTEIIASAFQFKTLLPGAESNYTNNAMSGIASIELQVHNVAVHSVLVIPTVIKLGQTPITINVVIQNLGTFSETFSVAVYHNSTLIENRTDLTLQEQSNTTLTFSWDTASLAIGKYGIVANVSRVPGEAVFEDNSKAFAGMVIISNPPVANFTYTPAHPRKGETITFNGTSSSDPDGLVEKWFWDFGDNSNITGTGITTTHTFTEVGTFNVTLTVVDDVGLNSSITQQLIVDKTLSVTSLEVSTNTTTLGRSVSLNGLIAPSPGAVDVTLNYRIQGAQNWITLAIVQTNATGYFSYTWAPPTANVFHVRATWEGTADILGAPSEIVQITVNKAPSQITCNANPKSVSAGTKVTISGTVTALVGTASQPKPGVTVTVYVQPFGQAETVIGTAVTGANGAYTIDYTPQTRGVYQVRASWNGDDNTLAATSDLDAITASEATGGDYTLYIVAGAVAIIVIIAVAVYFLKFRK